MGQENLDEKKEEARYKNEIVTRLAEALEPHWFNAAAASDFSAEALKLLQGNARRRAARGLKAIAEYIVDHRSFKRPPD